MNAVHVYFAAVLFVGTTTIFCHKYILDDNNGPEHQELCETAAIYILGIYMAIINPKKYTFEAFQQDERKIFKDVYKEYISLIGNQSINYLEWLIMNNFGLMSDTKESLIRPKFLKYSRADTKKLFINTVKKGDILISGRTTGGLLGHAAIMTSDYWVLEMRGGSGWAKGIESNNRQLSKDDWYSKYDSDWIKVYRCPDNNAAKSAAIWADYNYYNSVGGSEKTEHITYYLTHDFWTISPSYDSKLVIQAYYFGPETQRVVKDLDDIDHVIFPAKIPRYFRSRYKLVKQGEF